MISVPTQPGGDIFCLQLRRSTVHAGSIGLTGRQAKSRTCQGSRRARPTRRLRPKGSTAETPRNPHRVARGPGPSRGPGGFLGTFSAAKKYPGSGARSPGAVIPHQSSSPSSRIETKSSSATIMWSASRIPTVSSASRTIIVEILSSWEGTANPLGWLCARAT